jgi:hypothetical protein
MFKETFEFKDYFGVDRKEDHYFQLSEPEVMQLNFSSVGNLKDTVEKITQEQDGGRIISLFEQIIQKAHGERSEDGRLFIKNKEALERFIYSPVYSMMYMKLATDADYAARFLREILPKDMKKEMPANMSVVKH